MPGRKVVLATGEVYHIFNRSIESRPIFPGIRHYRRLTQALNFYQFFSPPVRFAQFLILSGNKRKELLEKLNQEDKRLVEMICFCLMPNHFHLLLKQSDEGGISKFMSLTQNSYTRYFNVRKDRVGSLFQGQFKAVRVETDEQLLHLSRYIHLNPYSSFVVKTVDNLKSYPWSSLPDYLRLNTDNFLKKDFVLDFFKNSADYQRFVFNRAEYQRELEKIKHLTLE